MKNTPKAAEAPANAATSPRPQDGVLAQRSAGMVQFSARDRNWQRISRRLAPAHVESILEGALMGDPTSQAELFSLMEDSWPRLMKNLNEVKRACARIPWQIQAYAEKGKEPSAKAQEKAALAEKALSYLRPDAARFELGMEDALYNILDALAKGISVLEVYWHDKNGGPFMPEPGLIAPRAFKFIPSRYYGFPTQAEEEDRLMLNLAGNGNAGLLSDFMPDKFLIGISQARTGHPANTALLRALAKYWIGATFGFQWLCNYAQVFGQPFRWATYDPHNKALLDDITAMLENMGSAGWGAFPIGTTLELKEASRGAQENPQAFLMDVADRACDILILGQTLTTDVGSSGSRALGETHAGIRLEVLKAGAGFAASVINSQLIPAILRMNYGEDSECPQFLMEVQEPEDEKAKAERDKILFVDMGLPVEKAYLYERHGVPEPQGDADLFEPAAKQQASNELEGGRADENRSHDGVSKERGNDKRPPSSLDAAAAPGLLALSSSALIEARKAAVNDRLTNNVLEGVTGVAQQWLSPVKPIFRELVRKAMDGSISDKDFLDAIQGAAARMPELFDQLDTEKLAGAMEAAMGAAAVNGAVNADLERKEAMAAKQ